MYIGVVYLRFSWLLSKYTSAWSVTSSGMAILYWLRPQEHDPCRDSWAIVAQLYKGAARQGEVDAEVWARR